MRSVYCFVGTCSTIKSVYKTVYPECLMLTAKEAMTLRSGRKEKRRALCLIGLTPHKDKGKKKHTSCSNIAKTLQALQRNKTAWC